MKQLTFASAHELASAIRERRVSATEVCEAYLAQIAKHNPTLNAVVTLDEAGARRRAREADAALDRGEVWGPLHGVPITLKDVWDAAGLRCTVGSGSLANRVATKDAPMMARLKAAGAVLLGKTNCELFPDNPFGLTNNPWDLARTPGTSSSGAVAALAAGLTALDIGSDLGGSITIPAHYCGVCGMRPTERRIPPGPIAVDPIPLWRNLMLVPGPIARSVADLRLALRLIAGPDGQDSDVPPVPWRDVPQMNMRDLRIAWVPTLPGLPVAPDIRAAIERLVSELERQGACVEEMLPAVDLAAQAQLGDQLFGILVSTFATPPATLRDYLTALHQRDTFIAAWERFFDTWDAFLYPAQIMTAPLQADVGKPTTIAGQLVNPYEGLRVSSLSPATGHPTVVIPLAKDSAGLPIGVQLMGRRWDDERLLAIAELVATITDGFQRPPGY